MQSFVFRTIFGYAPGAPNAEDAHMLSRTLLVVALLFLARTLHAAPADPARLEWFHDAKFGMFIHWGPYAVIAGEWKGKQNANFGEWAMLQFNISGPDYEQVARGFNPVKFDAEQWVKIARDAGMRYIVITSKHHDGFCMWGTKQTNYNIVDFTPFKRDVLKELADACRKHDMKLGLYYSIVDWHHPEFPPKYSNHSRGYHGFPNPNADINKYADYQLAQIRELLTNYGDICVAWFDGGGSFQNADRYGLLKGDEMVSLIRSLQPDCLINNRIGGDKWDYGTPEQKIPGEIQDQAFETCMTIGKKWGYNKLDTNYKSSQTLIRNLIDIAHKGGNFLLNVGPNAEGQIIPAHVERLSAMGKWLEVNGESIYGSKNSVFAELPWGRSTTKLRDGGESTRIYLHIFDWPSDGRLLVPGLKNRLRAYLLADYPQTQLKTENSDAGVVITGLPPTAPDPVATVIVLDFKGKPKLDAPATRPATQQAKNAAE